MSFVKVSRPSKEMLLTYGRKNSAIVITLNQLVGFDTAFQMSK